MKIPSVDLKAQYKSIKKEINQAIQNVLDSAHFIIGENVRKLEEEIAKYCGTKYAVGVASGTDALILSLDALSVGKGDEIITTPFTFIATSEAICRVGAKPVFVDINPRTYNLNVNQIESKITDKSKAILLVHLYGQSCDMDPIMNIAKKYNLYVIEDCAQAIGATYKSKISPRTKAKLSAGQENQSFDKLRIDPERSRMGQKSKIMKAGSMGDAGCLSFFPSKNLGAYGDGGMVVTNNEKMAKKIKILRVHGCQKKYYHLVDGYNSRLDELQAAILRVKLRHLDEWTEKRRQNAYYYNELFNSFNPAMVTTPFEPDYNKHVYYLYTIRAQHRDILQNTLKSRGVSTAVYYPVPLHLQEVYKGMGYKKGDFPIAEAAQNEVLSLPMYPELTQREQDYIIEKIKEFYKK